MKSSCLTSLFLSDRSLCSAWEYADHGSSSRQDTPAAGKQSSDALLRHLRVV